MTQRSLKIEVGRPGSSPHFGRRPSIVRVVELAQEVRDPHRAELGDEHVDVREPTEHVVEHHRRDRLHDRTVAPIRHPLEGVEVLVLVLGVLAPLPAPWRLVSHHRDVHGDPPVPDSLTRSQ